MRALKRVLSAATIASLLVFAIAGIASAHVTSKSIITENGECITAGTTECNAAAVYGPNGFSGEIFFAADEIGTTVTLVDYLCVHTLGDAAFKSYGGTYAFSLSEGGAPVGTTPETVTRGVDCTDGHNAVTSGSLTFVVPSDGSVDYTLSITGITAGTSAQTAFSGYNSILNRVVQINPLTGATIAQAQSISVQPPTTFLVPEAPLAILLLLTGGIGAAWFVSRRMRSTSVLTPAS